MPRRPKSFGSPSVTGHGPASQERLDFRRLSRAETDWVSKVVLAEAA